MFVVLDKPKPSDISCQARADANGDKLYCTISNIYSSRGIYTCQALRREEHNVGKKFFLTCFFLDSAKLFHSTNYFLLLIWNLSCISTDIIM